MLFAVALLEAGARTDVRDDVLKSTPLGWACRWGRTPIVALIRRGSADEPDPTDPLRHLRCGAPGKTFRTVV